MNPPDITPDQIIRACSAPNSKGVFFLGCFDSRVTVYAQQVRALNLVDALISRGIIEAGSRVAVIGAGAAGITAAAALIVAIPDGKIDLFERQSRLMHLQHQSHDRLLHPNLYDWPSDLAQEPYARLPILNWQAATAGKVADRLREQFEHINRGRINVMTSCLVTGISNGKHSGCMVALNGRTNDNVYDAVIVAVGYGYEIATTDSFRSYWERAFIPGAIRSNKSQNNLFISGNGDGGLVDFQMAVFDALNHEQICQLVTNSPGLKEAERILSEIEDEAWSTDEPFDIFGAYRTRVTPVLPKNFLNRVREHLRVDVNVTLHTRDSQLFRKNTAIHNRFGSFLAIMADENVPPCRIITIVGKKFVNADVVPLVGDVAIEGEAIIKPDYRIFRFGADVKENLDPFRDFADSCEAARAGGTPTRLRPATPILSSTAAERFTVVPQQLLPEAAQAGQVSDQSKPAVNYARATQPSPAFYGPQVAAPESTGISKATPTVTVIAADQVPGEYVADVAGSSATTGTGKQLGQYEPLLSDSVPSVGASSADGMNSILQKRHSALVNGAGVYSMEYKGIPLQVIVTFGQSNMPQDSVAQAATTDTSVVAQKQPAQHHVANVPVDTTQESELLAIANRAEKWIAEIISLLGEHESSKAIALIAEIDDWLATKATLLNSELLVRLYEQLIRVAVIQAQRDATNPNDVDVSKARFYLEKARNAKTR